MIERGALLLALMLAILVARAISQEIVIEPTNGRAQSNTHAARLPVASEPTAAAKSAASAPVKSPVARKKQPAKTVAKAKAPELPKPAAVTAPVVAEAPEPAPVPKKIPAQPAWVMSDTRSPQALQAEISNAFMRDPSLTASEINVKVDGTSVILEGHAAGPEQRLQAERLASSYAWNRKLVDKLEITPGPATARR